MSQKKAQRNRARKVTRDLNSLLVSGNGWKTILAHLVWCLPADEMRAKFNGAGPIATVRLVSIDEDGVLPELSFQVAAADVLKLISDDVDEDMIQVAADDYFDLLNTIFPGESIASLIIDRLDGLGPQEILTIRPEDYPVENSE